MRALVEPVRALLPWFDEIAKFGEAPLKAQLNRANRPVTLLADDHLGLAMKRVHILLPFCHCLEVFFAWFFAFFVIFAPLDEHDHLGILLD